MSNKLVTVFETTNHMPINISHIFCTKRMRRGGQQNFHNFVQTGHQERDMLKTSRKREVQKLVKVRQQTPASYFPCALSQQMYFPTVKQFPNVSRAVFKCISSSFQMYLKQFPNVSQTVSKSISNGFQVYLQMYFPSVKQFPNVSQAVSK